LVVCLDVEAETPARAYGQTYEGMTLSGLDWESSDEWFGADGDLADPEELQAARMEYMADKPDSPVPARVFIVTYTHKHGGDVGAYRTREGAINAAHQLAFERVTQEDKWDAEDVERFQNTEDAEEAIDIFNTVEQDWSYGENLEITEAPLGD